MPNNRPRSPDADAEARASIEEAERLGVIPRAVDLPVDQLDGGTLRERDYRVNPPAPKDRPPPFKVTP